MGIEPITRNLQGFVATLSTCAPVILLFGGVTENRTQFPSLQGSNFNQINYNPILVEIAGLEPATSPLSGGVLYQLSYISNTGGGYGIRTHLIPSVQAKCPLQADPTPILFGGSSRTRTYHLTVISRVL